MAAREHEREPLVRQGAHLVRVHGQRLEPREDGGLVGENALTTDPVDGAVAGGGDDPGARVVRESRLRPALERRRKGILHRVLGAFEIAEDAGQDRDAPRPLLCVDRGNALGHRLISGRISRVPYSRRGNERGDADRLVEVGQVGDEHAAELLLRLGERPVGDDRLAVDDTDDLRLGCAHELTPLHVRVGLPELVEERDPAGHRLLSGRGCLVLGHRRPRGLVAVDEHRVLHAAASSSTWTGRISIAPPVQAAGIFAAQSIASSSVSHENR